MILNFTKGYVKVWFYSKGKCCQHSGHDAPAEFFVGKFSMYFLMLVLFCWLNLIRFGVNGRSHTGVWRIEITHYALGAPWAMCTLVCRMQIGNVN